MLSNIHKIHFSSGFISISWFVYSLILGIREYEFLQHSNYTSWHMRNIYLALIRFRSCCGVITAKIIISGNPFESLSREQDETKHERNPIAKKFICDAVKQIILHQKTENERQLKGSREGLLIPSSIQPV